MARQRGPVSTLGYFAPVSGAKYIQLTTYRRAARLLAARHPLLHGWLIPWYHRRRGWTTQHYQLEPPAAAA
jgi:hypothetical protein